MFEIALLRPEIPPNTGNIIRLCANMGCSLHIIGPTGFSLENKQMRRAGLDYHDMVIIHYHNTLEAFNGMLAQRDSQHRLFICTSKGTKTYTDIQYVEGDILMFGPETLEFPEEVLAAVSDSMWLRIPMKDQSRCLNLSNAVAIIAYEAWRQNGFIRGQ